MITVLEARLKLSKEVEQEKPIEELDGLTVKDVRKILLDVCDQDTPLDDLRIDNEAVKYWLVEQLQENQ